MSDDARRMFQEASDRINDAEILTRSAETRSDSSALLMILGFEELLKCAILLSSQTPKQTHDYEKLWSQLPCDASSEILRIAEDRSPGFTDFSNVSNLLKWYRYIFTKARYFYELYNGWTLDEQKELGNLWKELGAPAEEAEVQYYPEELLGLIEGLKVHIQARLSNKTI
ncbi:hypothetical protein [Halomonas heilongjiangensis]|uniref:HEPN domain-containing protein n=1 Tax=Halomonas heilongjiangensis TaxID=1387883 RepID=A0A2N7TG02_9GAMM|nr:hypothetical protein [Halomonas heilongjiangensis]PMR67095.1 hypothetical protein C1H66_20665 [Halomonas heilongjiangensis]PXX87831.1 hypothetical protein CR158_15920 [Halomonas heilongjiangensis]